MDFHYLVFEGIELDITIWLWTQLVLFWLLLSKMGSILDGFPSIFALTVGITEVVGFWVIGP